MIQRFHNSKVRALASRVFRAFLTKHPPPPFNLVKGNAQAGLVPAAPVLLKRRASRPTRTLPLHNMRTFSYDKYDKFGLFAHPPENEDAAGFLTIFSSATFLVVYNLRRACSYGFWV